MNRIKRWIRGVIWRRRFKKYQKHLLEISPFFEELISSTPERLLTGEEADRFSSFIGIDGLIGFSVKDGSPIYKKEAK